MNDATVKQYRTIISQYWKFFQEALLSDFGTDAMWSKAVKQTGELQKIHKCRLSERMTYVVLDEMDKIQKRKENPDLKIYYNVFLDCGNAIGRANDWDAFCDFIKGRFARYDGMRFAETMFDLFQREAAENMT